MKRGILRLPDEAALNAIQAKQRPRVVLMGTARRGKTVPALHTPEAIVLKLCLELLHAHPKVALCWRNNVGAMQYASRTGATRFVRFGTAGMSDILGVLKGGKIFAVECKSTGKRPTDAQNAFLDAIRHAGGAATCVDSVRLLGTWLDAL